MRAARLPGGAGASALSMRSVSSLWSAIRGDAPSFVGYWLGVSATAIVRCGGRGNPRMTGARISSAMRSERCPPTSVIDRNRATCTALRVVMRKPVRLLARATNLTNKIYLDLPTVVA